jgi:tetratricopeptide (TPR) repeat protein
MGIGWLCSLPVPCLAMKAPTAEPVPAGHVAELCHQAWEARYSNPQLTLQLAEQARVQAQELADNRGYALATRYAGVALALQSQFEQSLQYLNEAQELYRKLGERVHLVATQANLGATYVKMGQFDAGLNLLQEVLPQAHEQGMPEVEANTLSNIAEIYMDTRQFSQALDYEQRAIELREVLNDEVGIAFGLGAIGRIYLGMEKFDRAQEYYERSLIRARKLNDTASLAYTLRGLGEVARKTGRFRESLQHLEEANTYFRQIADPQLLAENEILMAKTHVGGGDLESAEALAKHALGIGRDINDKMLQSDALDVMSRVSARRGDYEQALERCAQFTELKVQLLEHASQQSQRFMQARFELEQQQKNRQIEKLKNRDFIRELALIEQNSNQIQQRAAEVNATMRYAHRIQEQVLCKPEAFAQLVPRSYCIVRPKDFVSGDFFWFTKVESTLLIALADCTGVGIPAAMLSVLGNSLLNDIVHHRQVLSPPKILGQLHTGIRKALHQHTPRGANSADSLDIALLSLNPVSLEMNFTGGMQSLYLLKRGTMEEVKGDRFSVGGPQEEAFRIYTNHRFVIQGNEQFVLISDGFLNQQGGEAGKRYSSKRLRDLLETLTTVPFEQQQPIVERAFDDWRGDYEQTDDMLFLSFKLV